MDGFCDVLKDAGAEYYPDLGEFPEVVSLGLLQRDQSKNNAFSPDSPGSRGSGERVEN
jgi:hypothetical protein